MAKDILQRSVTPQKPNILAQERVTVYIPQASKNSPGIASFEERDFNINNSHVTLMWPKQMEVEQLADPLLNVAEIKLLEDEFENTGREASVTNPVTGTTYKSKTAEVKLKRTERNATIRPDLIKVSPHEFDTIIEDNGEVLHKLAVNNPFEEPSLIKINTEDFKSGSDGIQVNWPMAHDESGSKNTDGYGLVKIAPNSADYLKYKDGMLSVDDSHLFENAQGAQVRPTYGGTEASGFTTKNDYISANGIAKRNTAGNVLIAITKDAVGLTNVENRTFASRQYEEFGSDMQMHFTTEFGLKLDKTTWNGLFSDWTPPNNEERTPQLRFDKLVEMHNAQQEQIDTLKDIKSFLGYFVDYDELVSAYTASKTLVGCNAYLLSTNTYWGVRRTVLDTYEWYDTGIAEKKFADYVETDPKRLKPNGEASVGTSGLWIQSDHIHPTDLSRLATSIYKATTVKILSEFSSESSEFGFNLWNENAEGIYQPDIKVNIPYIRKSQSVHNWAGSHGAFTDTETSEQKIWVGSKEDYQNEVSEMPNNTVFFVDDEEEFTVDSFVSDAEMYQAGIIIDSNNQTEKMVITNVTKANDLVDKFLTLQINERPDGEKMYTLVSKDLPAPTTYTPNRIMVTDAKGLPAASTMGTNDVVTATVTMSTNALVLASGSNKIKSYHTGNIANKPIVTDGAGSVKTMPTPSVGGKLIVGTDEGAFDYAPILESNVLVTSTEEKTNLLTANRVLISGANNTVTTYNTGTENKMLVANGSGGIKQSTITANRLLYTSAQGVPAAFAMSAADVGKVIRVDTNGNPSLSAISIPTTLPITTQTTAPTAANNAGTKLVILNNAPTTMYSGYIYLW